MVVIGGVSPHDTAYGGEDELSSGPDSDGHSSVAPSPETRRNLSSDFGNAAEALDPPPFQTTQRGGLPTTAKETKDGETPTDPVVIDPEGTSSDVVQYACLDSDGENDEGSGWDYDELTGEGEPYYGIDEDNPPQPELLFDSSLLNAVGGVDRIAVGNVKAPLLRQMAKYGWGPLKKQTPYEYLMKPYEPRPSTGMRTDYPRLYSGEYGPTTRALHAAVTPSGAFFYSMKPGLWEDIANASNDYFNDKLDERVEGIYNKQVAREKKHPGFKRKERVKIKADFDKIEAISGRELCVFIGLLIARTICPNKEKLENHWKPTNEGAIPRGCFGQYMVRDRFMHLSRNLHFSDNSDPEAVKDRAWKLRPVINSLQQRFQAGYLPPPAMAFDEAMLPSQSSFNRMRVFMKDKAHRWGTKLFMLCCSTTAYCIMYSLQLAIKYKKYYKSLFLGLVDLAVINAYIVYNARRAADGMKKLSHVKFLKQLHLELCQLRDEDWFALRSNTDTTPSKRRTKSTSIGHNRVQNDEWRADNNHTGRKRRTRVCKVCSLLKGSDDVRGGDSSVYCSDCKLTTTSKRPQAWRVFLCDKARREYNGVPMTCFDIWHRVWKNGTLLPTLARKRKIRARTPAKNRSEEEARWESEASSGNSSEDEDAGEPESGGRRQPKRLCTDNAVD